MNEQQMEAVERLVESGIFPKGLIAITEPPSPKMDSCQVYFVPVKNVRRPTALHNLNYDIMHIRDDEDDCEDWKRAGVS